MKPKNARELLHGIAVLLMFFIAACSNLETCPPYAIAGLGIAIALYFVGDRL